MKKIFFTLVFCAFFINVYNIDVQAKEDMVTIKIPASEIDTIDVKYEKPKQPTTTKTSKAVTATKDAANKTVNATKDFTEKTVDGAKDIINNLNPNKPVTLEELETKSQIRILKNETKGLKSAYNSRIKDIDAKIKDSAMEKYDKKIEAVKEKK